MGQNFGTGMVQVRASTRDRQDGILAGMQCWLWTRALRRWESPEGPSVPRLGVQQQLLPHISVPAPPKNLFFQEMQANPSGCHDPTGIHPGEGQ